MPEFRADSEIDICNQALGHCQAPSITGFDQANSKAARQCKLHYAVTRDRLLAEYRWNFSTKRGTLANVAAPEFGYSHAYARPADCLRILEIDGYRRENWIVEGELILIDRAPPLKARWLWRNTEPRLMDAAFVELLSYELALKIAPALTRYRAIVREIERVLNDPDDGLRRRAKKADALEGREEIDPYESQFLEARMIP